MVSEGCVFYSRNLQFSTPIGSGALTFLKATIMAGLIYAPGAAFGSKSIVNALFSDVHIIYSNIPHFLSGLQIC